jgi:DNA-binding transcriptional regulator of glucitol operon
MRYRLRTLLILMAILPPLLSIGWWQWSEYKARQARIQELSRLVEIAVTFDVVGPITAKAVNQYMAEKAERERSAEPNP